MGRQSARKTLEAQTILPVLAVVVLICIAVAAFDLMLVRVAARHRSESGTQLFESGLAAQRAGKTSEALEYFRSAFNRRPQNPEYHLAFARALHAAGRIREGRAALEELLARRPAHGEANVEMARLLADAGNWQNAAWFYHRALYGEWTRSPDLRALRFELADLLAVHDAREQLVSEVVLLSAEPAQPTEAKHLARLQLAAGEWARAEQSFRALVRAEPDHPELIAGLARAQLGLGRYAAAERGYRRALAAGATGESVTRDLDLVRTLNSMDPTIRGLAPREKHRRAHQLSSALAGAFRKCAADNQLLADSERLLGEHERTNRPLEAAESDLDVFDRLWSAREPMCGGNLELPQAVELLAIYLTR